MLLTRVQLKDLGAKLHDARRDHPGCDAPRDGDPVFLPKPNAIDPATRVPRKAGHVYANGDKLVKHKGVLGIMQSPGIHGRAFLAIDPETGDVVCGACAEQQRTR